MKNQKPTSFLASSSLNILLLLIVILAILFWRSFLPDYVHFSNDGPLGQQNARWLQLPGGFTGLWDDLNDVGYTGGSFSPTVSALFKWAVGPVGDAKFYAPFALFLVGLGAWTFFRCLKLTPAAAVLGAIAAMLNSAYFGNACWGVASGEIALAFNFLALALVVANTAETSRLVRWSRLALAGFCVGVNIMEGADIGALYSLMIAAFVFYKSLVEPGIGVGPKIIYGIGRVALIAIFAGFLAAQTVFSLVQTEIQGIAGTGQESETKAANWDKATQWSLPKAETLGLVVPGLFGYKMDTPQGMMPAFQEAFEGGAYWGGMGRDPANDRFFDSGGQGTPPNLSYMRQTGGGDYCGILVAIVAAWTIAESLRRKNSVFSLMQKRLIWFWAAMLVIAVPLAWGRFAPFSKTSDSPLFYALLYHLPYFSTIRNPAKFTLFICWALVILFAYGIHALNRRQMETIPANVGPFAQFKSWWTHASGFDRKVIFAGIGIFGVSIAGWLVYSSEKSDLIQYLQKRGFPDENFANQLATFSIGQVAWFIFLLAIALILLALLIAGYFSGKRTRLGLALLGAFLLFDLGRADLPYIIHWDYIQKYEIGSLNPVESFLRDKSYEHRVAGLPFDPSQPLPNRYDNYFGGMGMYRIEWTQHHFPYYNIQCLDLIQMSRMPEDLKMYLEDFIPHSLPEYPLITRHWELTNTRYLLGAAGFLDVLNQQLDPGQHRFRIAQHFDLTSKPGILQLTQLEDLTAVTNADGELALFEFTGALPRAKLYSNWQVNTNDQAVLKTLADLSFDPWKTVLISTPEKNLPAAATNENSGTVTITSYASKKIVLEADATAPSILLLNDKYDSGWTVTVDGHPAQLLRCNFLMRGVQLAAGNHVVEFDYQLPSKPLYITLAAIGVGIFLSALLVFLTRKPQNSVPK